MVNGEWTKAASGHALPNHSQFTIHPAYFFLPAIALAGPLRVRALV
jgi:hypothetical protein